MNIIIPLAGRGSRFKEAGYTLPKPLIPIKGKLMIGWATDSIAPLLKEARVIFIILEKDAHDFQLDLRLKEKYGDKCEVVIAPHVTEGALLSVLLAREFIAPEEELIIYNGDQYFKNFDLDKVKLQYPEAEGVIPIFHSTHPRWSFVRLGENNRVLEVIEKVPISTHATVGLYYFKKGRYFLEGAQVMIDKDLRRNNEFYVAPVYNELIRKGLVVFAVEVAEMWGLGAPEDVIHFEKYYR